MCFCSFLQAHNTTFLWQQTTRRSLQSHRFYTVAERPPVLRRTPWLWERRWKACLMRIIKAFDEVCGHMRKAALNWMMRFMLELNKMMQGHSPSLYLPAWASPHPVGWGRRASPRCLPWWPRDWDSSYWGPLDRPVYSCYLEAWRENTCI